MQQVKKRNPKKRVQQAGVKKDAEGDAGRRAARKERRARARARAASPDLVMNKSGASGVDYRVPSRAARMVGTSTIAVVNQDPTLDVTCRITQRSLAYLAMGTVLRAIKRGWLGSATGVGAYTAWRYLIQSYKNSVDGTLPAITGAPRWYWELNQALLPKTEKFKTGHVTYTGFNLDDGEGVDQNFQLGSSSTYAYSVFWGNVVVGNGDVNGFPILFPAATYTDALGAESIQSLFAFFENKGMCKRSGKIDAAELDMTHDTSAFTAVYPEMGASFSAPGGSATTLQSERYIRSPVVAKFVQYQENENLYRGFHEYHRGTGSATYLGARVTELFVPGQLRNKIAPIFKWYLFDQFFNQLSLTLCMAIEENYRATSILPVPCPLTSQEVQLMLRQAMLPFFSNDMAQDLRLEEPSWIPLLPFVVGPNGVSQGQVGNGPLLPFFFAESIRSATRITACITSKGNKNFKGPSASATELDIVPILARPSYAIYPALGNYTLDAGGVVELYTTGVETPISLIDASATVSSATVYVDLNGPTMALLVQNWNRWIQQYSGTLVSLVQLSNDKGCAALSTLPYTNILRTVEQESILVPTPPLVEKTSTSSGNTTPVSVQKGLKKQNSATKHFGRSHDHLRHRVGAAPSPGPSEMFTKIAVAGTSAGLGFTSEIWKFLSLWSLPVAFSQAPIFESCLSAYQANVVEPMYLPSSAASTQFAVTGSQMIYPFVSDKDLQFASMNIRAYNSPVLSEMEIEFKALAEKGDGGFFTSIAGLIGESFGIKGSAQFMHSVGDATGL